MRNCFCICWKAVGSIFYKTWHDRDTARSKCMLIETSKNFTIWPCDPSHHAQVRPRAIIWQLPLQLAQLHGRTNPPFFRWMEHYHKRLAAGGGIVFQRICEPLKLLKFTCCLGDENGPLPSAGSVLDFWAPQARPRRLVQSGRTSLDRGGERCQEALGCRVL